MIEKTEQEIMKNWQGNITKPVVSVCCITYNHENFINEALESFLMQETSFPFEILIDDDCSKDNTRSIIKKYQEKYPSIIKPLLRDVNVGSMTNFIENMKRATGEYIAICEGDDYWTDEKKLQIQLDEMKKNPDVDISFHPAYELIDGKRGNILAEHSEENKIFTTSEVILGDGGFMPTASLIVKKTVADSLPEWFHKDAPVGDYFIQIFGAKRGGALYINKLMAVYRMGHKESWTHRTHRKKMPKEAYEKKKILQKREQYFKNYLETLKNMNIYLEEKYIREIDHAKANVYFSAAIFYLKNKYYAQYKHSIEICKKTYKFESKVFTLLYNFRLFPRFVYFMVKIKKLLIHL